MAEALYNKYRPQIFEDVVGQEHIERTLKNAIASDKISHAYLFAGPRGTGKTTTARLLSKALLCESGPTPDPDGKCEDCQLIADGEHPDVYELDAASRTGVENVREEIIGKVNYAPTRGRYKVYIIDEVHMLSTAAFNALLKTLEEPPGHVIFILCTTDPQKIPETIISRCQRFDFRRISSEELISRLGAICEMEGVPFEGDALDLIAHRAQGGMRDALTSLDQLIAFGEGEVTTEVAERMLGSLDSSDLAEIVKAIGQRDAAACFRWTSEYMETGADLVQFVQDLTEHMRDMYVMSLAGADVALELTEAGRRELESELAWFGPDRLSRLLGVLGDLASELKTSTNQRLSFEIALTRMVRPDSDITIESLAERIEQLERTYAQHSEQPYARPSEQSIRHSERSEESPRMQADPSTPALRASAQDDARSAWASAQDDVNDHARHSERSEESSRTQANPSASTGSQQQTSGLIDASQLWNATLAHLKKIGPAYGVVYMNTKVSLDGNTLTIGFPKDSSFAFKAAQKQDAREALDKALERAGAKGIAVNIIQDENVSSISVKEAKAAKPAQSATPNVSQQVRRAVEKQEQTVQQVQEQPQQAQQLPQEERVFEEPKNAAPEVGQAAFDEPQEDPDFQDFLTAAFGENIQIEEIQD